MAQPTKKTKLKQWPLQFLIQAKQLKARQIYKFRAGNLRLPHGTVQTPVFMPVATRGAFKGVTMKQVESIGFRLILGNTYHLQFHPGSSFIKQCQSLHGFVNWPHNMLTDSGGFQMVSLRKLSEVTEEGVKFQSPVDQSLMMLTPEKSIQIQNELGADIAMALDDVVQPNSERIVEAAHRTIRWLDRCIQAHNNPQQNLFGIIQGGVDQSLRKMCCEELVKRDLPGYAIGGLAGGEEKPDF